jgi:hypothetical protein
VIDIYPAGMHKKIADDVRLAYDVTRKLEIDFPGYEWSVFLDEDGGVIQITNETLQPPIMSHSRYAYVIHLKTLYADRDRLRKVREAGGEIIERARMDTKGWDGHTLPNFIEGVEREHQPILDANGYPIILT